jgi:hypothetical protein
MTPAPRIALAVKFTVATAVALAILIPATLSYAIPAWEKPIENLDFGSGKRINPNAEPSFTHTLADSDLWKSVPSSPGWDDGVKYESVSGNCDVRMLTWDLPQQEENGDDAAATEAYIKKVFTSGDQDALTNMPVDKSVNYRATDSGRTVDGYVTSNSVSKSFFRAFSVTDTVLSVDVGCTDDSEEAAALTEDAFLHIAIVTD